MSPVPTDVTLVRRMADIDRHEWDALVGPDGSPFLEWDWLDALEQSGCVSTKTGWAPHHLTVRDERPPGRCRADVPQGPQSGRVRLRPHLGRGGAARRHRLLSEAARRRAADAGHRPAHSHPPGTAARGAARRRRRRAARALRLGNEISSVHVNFCAADELAPLREPPGSCTVRASSTIGATATSARSTTTSPPCAASGARRYGASCATWPSRRSTIDGARPASRSPTSSSSRCSASICRPSRSCTGAGST